MGLIVARSRRAAALVAACLALVPFASAPRAHATFVDVGVSVLDAFNVDSSNPNGNASSVLLRKNRVYTIDVSGVFSYGRGKADAECSTLDAGTTWQAQRFIGQFGDATADWLDLYIAGTKVTWQPVGTSGDCSTVGTHPYRVTFTPATTGPVRFAIRDTFHGDNSGSLRVSVFLAALDGFGDTNVDAGL